jgi:lipooligosaccharide transport system ATP-binding protein
VPSNLVEEEIGREVVEVRVPKEEDEKLIQQLSSFSCEHERVGDTLYFYCRDGQGLMRRMIELDLHNYLTRPATLEDVFLKLTGRGLIE